MGSIMAALPDCKPEIQAGTFSCACGEREMDSWGGAIFPSISLSFEAHGSRILGIDSGGSFQVCVPPEAYVQRTKDGRCYLAIADGGSPHQVFGHEAVVYAVRNFQSCAWVRRCLALCSGKTQDSRHVLVNEVPPQTESYSVESYSTESYRDLRISRLLAPQDVELEDIPFVEAPSG